MNRVLKVVFSRAKGMFVVVSELGRACTKGSLKSVLVAVPLVLVSAGAIGAESETLTEVDYGIDFGGTVSTPASATNAGSIAIGNDANADGESINGFPLFR